MIIIPENEQRCSICIQAVDQTIIVKPTEMTDEFVECLPYQQTTNNNQHPEIQISICIIVVVIIDIIAAVDNVVLVDVNFFTVDIVININIIVVDVAVVERHAQCF